MKKKISFIALFILIVLIGAACGKKAELPASTPTSAPTEAPATATPEPTATSTPIPTDTPTPEPLVPLREFFAEHGMKVGTCLTPKMITTKKYEEFILTHFSSVTMENHMKPESIINQAKSIAANDIVIEFSADTVKMLDWAKANGIAMRGHTLVWHSQTPDWIFHEEFNSSKPFVTREVMLERMDSYFKQVFTYLTENGYADMFYAYDVANECWMEDGSMRQSYWLQVIGEDYLWHAFNTAKKYAPSNISLYYNDYNEQFKSQTLVDFVQTLKDDNGNYLIDGVGFQAHLYTSDDLDTYFNTVDALGALGIKVELTELDVCLGKYQGYLPQNEETEAVQGQFYYNLVNGLLSRKDAGTLNIDSLTIWGFSDYLSWRSEGHPLPFNMGMQPKPAYYGMIQDKENAGF